MILFILLLTLLIALLQNFLNDDIEIIQNPNPPLRTNSKKEKIIIAYKGGNYDITDFIKKHPGGKEILKENNGKNIEQQMLDAGHSNNAYNILEKYKI